MSNEQVILQFLEKKEAHTPTREIPNGYFIYKGRTLTSTGNKLINYNTIISYWEDNKLYLNIKKYSITTSKIQSKIKYLAFTKNIDIIEYQG